MAIPTENSDRGRLERYIWAIGRVTFVIISSATMLRSYCCDSCHLTRNSHFLNFMLLGHDIVIATTKTAQPQRALISLHHAFPSLRVVIIRKQA